MSLISSVPVAVAIVAAVPVLSSGSGSVRVDDKTAPDCRVAAPSQVEAGRYLVKVAGCNDCHTPGYMEMGLRVPEQEWLTGTRVGWRGPWGTTYPTNLRRFVQETPEDVWLTICRERKARPPMPWDNLHSMSDADLRAIHAYIRHLGPAGEPVPSFCEPGDEPSTPYFLLDPEELGFRRVYAAKPDTKLAASTGCEAFDVMGIGARVRVPSCDTRDAYSLMELTVPAQTGTPLHALRLHDKVIDVVDGQLEVLVGDRVLLAGAGDCVVVPRGTLHALRNEGRGPVRVHVLTSPGGHDEFLSELAALDTQATREDLDQLYATYGVELVTR